MALEAEIMHEMDRQQKCKRETDASLIEAAAAAWRAKAQTAGEMARSTSLLCIIVSTHVHFVL